MDVRHPYAGFWRRVLGSFIDAVILAIPIIAIVTLFGIVFGRGGFVAAQFGLVALIYAYAAIGNGMGGTLGKGLAGLRVVDVGGAPPGLGRGIVRIVPNALIALIASAADLGQGAGADRVSPLDLVGLLALFDGLWMIWDPRKQTLHDKLAGTFVVDVRHQTAGVRRPADPPKPGPRQLASP